MALSYGERTAKQVAARLVLKYRTREAALQVLRDGKDQLTPETYALVEAQIKIMHES